MHVKGKTWSGQAPSEVGQQKVPDSKADKLKPNVQTDEGSASVQGGYRPGDEGRLSAEAQSSGAGGQKHEIGLRAWQPPQKTDGAQRASSFSQVLAGDLPPDFKSVADYAEWAIKDSFKLEPGGQKLAQFKSTLASAHERLEQALAFVDEYSPNRGSVAAQTEHMGQPARSFAQVLVGQLPPSFASVREYAEWSIKDSFKLPPSSSELEQFRSDLQGVGERLAQARAFVDRFDQG